MALNSRVNRIAATGIGLVFVMIPPATVQTSGPVRKPPSRPRIGLIVRMAADPDVQDDLKLSSEKRKTLGTLAQQLMKAAGDCNCDGSDKESVKRREETMGKIKALDEQAKKTLSKGELVRIRQILWQLAGPLGIVGQEEMLNQLRLSEEKKKKLYAIYWEYNTASNKLRSARPDPATGISPLEQKRKEAEQKILDTLSPAERSRYKALLGEPFQRRKPTEARRATGE